MTGFALQELKKLKMLPCFFKSTNMYLEGGMEKIRGTILWTSKGKKVILRWLAFDCSSVPTSCCSQKGAPPPPPPSKSLPTLPHLSSFPFLSLWERPQFPPSVTPSGVRNDIMPTNDCAMALKQLSRVGWMDGWERRPLQARRD